MGVNLFGVMDVEELDLSYATTWAATTTSYALPTDCLAFDARASTYGAPAQVASASAADASKKNQGVSTVLRQGSCWLHMGIALAVVVVL